MSKFERRHYDDLVALYARNGIEINGHLMLSIDVLENFLERENPKFNRSKFQKKLLKLMNER